MLLAIKYTNHNVKKILFLDLEDTVIDDFSKGAQATLLNTDAVRSFIASEAPDAVRIFSFALYSDRCKEQFRRCFETRLNQALSVQLDTTRLFTTPQLLQLCRRHGTYFEDDHECLLFHGKDYGFQRFVEMSAQFDDVEVVLLDDVVEPKTIHYPKRALTIRLININQLLH